MRGFSGVSYRPSSLSSFTRAMFKDLLSAFPEYGDVASEWEHKDRMYLYCPNYGKLSIFGFKIDRKDAGTIWGANEKNILEALQRTDLIDDCFPYKVHPCQIYYVQNGEVYIHYKKGDRISTKEGQGTIWSIDDVNDICVELDNDKSVFFEYGLKEIEKVKED